MTDFSLWDKKDDNRFWRKRSTLKNCQFKIIRNLFLALKIIYLN